MNTGLLDALTSYELASMRAVVGKVVEDTEIGAVSATFRARSGRGYSPGSGTVSHAETSTTLYAMISPLTEREVAALDGARIGDVSILITVAALATPPRVDDRLTTLTTTYHIVSVDQVGVATHYRLVGRKA